MVKGPEEGQRTLKFSAPKGIDIWGRTAAAALFRFSPNIKKKMPFDPLFNKIEPESGDIQ
jgi:hypothetical protein